MGKQRRLNRFLVVVVVLLCLSAATLLPKSRDQRGDVNELELYYQACNERYFGNGLPKDVIIYWDASMDVDELATMSLSQITEQFVVRVSLNLQFSQTLTRMVLLQEMVHIKLWNVTQGHGKPFQDEMLSLAKRGAFEGLW